MLNVIRISKNQKGQSLNLSLMHFLQLLTSLTSNDIPFDRKTMVGEPKSYHKTPETSYLKEGFSGIQNAAMVLIISDQINEV